VPSLLTTHSGISIGHADVSAVAGLARAGGPEGTPAAGGGGGPRSEAGLRKRSLNGSAQGPGAAGASASSAAGRGTEGQAPESGVGGGGMSLYAQAAAAAAAQVAEGGPGGGSMSLYAQAAAAAAQAGRGEDARPALPQLPEATGGDGIGSGGGGHSGEVGGGIGSRSGAGSASGGGGIGSRSASGRLRRTDSSSLTAAQQQLHDQLRSQSQRLTKLLAAQQEQQSALQGMRLTRESSASGPARAQGSCPPAAGPEAGGA